MNLHDEVGLFCAHFDVVSCHARRTSTASNLALFSDMPVFALSSRGTSRGEVPGVSAVAVIHGVSLASGHGTEARGLGGDTVALRRLAAWLTRDTSPAYAPIRVFNPRMIYGLDKGSHSIWRRTDRADANRRRGSLGTESKPKYPAVLSRPAVTVVWQHRPSLRH